MFKCNSIFINDINKLNLFKNTIFTSSVIAIDTEFTRKSTYKANLSILQICNNIESVFIIDYLQNPEIVLDVIDIIYTSKAVKVFHAAKNDLEILYNLTNKLPKNIFDTQVAYSALSTLNNVSYAYLIKKTLNIQLDKSETLSDWNKRPFSEKQIIYASQDVNMLFKAYHVLYNNLKALNRLDYIKEKLNSLVDINQYIFNLDKSVEQYITQYNIKKNYSLLAAIINCRETIAHERNIPKKYILEDSKIKEIVNNPKFGNIIFKTNKYLNNQIWEEVVQISNTKFSHFNKLKLEKPLPTHQLLDISLIFLEYISFKEKINKNLICTKVELNKFLNHFDFINKKTTIKKDIESFFIEWRYNLFTKKLEEFLTGKINLTINNGNIKFK